MTCCIMSMVAMVHHYNEYQGCFNSPHFKLTELLTAPSNVKEINFNVVTGSVVFGVHDGDEIVVNLYLYAREALLLEDMDGKVRVEDHTIYIDSVSPAFNYGSCQYSYIEVLFPEEISKQTNEVHITGNMKAGYVGAELLSNLGNVHINVEVGVVEMEGINAESMNVETGLGAIWIGSVWSAKSTKFSVGTGSVSTEYISTPVFETSVTHGYNWNTDITADEATVTTSFGYSGLLGPSHFTTGTDQTVMVQTYYGQSLAVYENWYNLDFTVGNGVGQATVVFDNDECELEEKEELNVLLGVCPAEIELEPRSSITINTFFGDSYLFQAEADWDMLEDNIDASLLDIAVEDLDEDEQE